MPARELSPGGETIQITLAMMRPYGKGGLRLGMYLIGIYALWMARSNPTIRM